MATVKEAERLMRASDDNGILWIDGRCTSLVVALQRASVTAKQAAKAARRLKWVSDSVDDWSDVLEVR